MARVQVYTKRNCAYCVRAKALLQKKGVPYEEIDVEGDDGRRDRLVEVTGQRTVPQIFVGDVHVGGYSDLVALDAAGGFTPLLRAPAG